MFSGYYFQYPYFIALVIVFLICERFCKMRLSSIYFPHTAQFMTQTLSSSKLLWVLKWIGIIGMILALMSPVKDEPYELKPKQGYEIALILDTSQSMATRGFDRGDVMRTRFDVVQEIVADFISHRKNDNIGLVVFGNYSFIASPLTYDKNILKKIVSQLYIGMAGRNTALYESLAQGVNLLKMGKSDTKVAILLTDGYNTNGGRISLETAIELAKKEGIKIYPIGIGSNRDYNKKVLIKIAKESGGVAFGASSASKLKEVYKQIDELEKSELKSETFTYKNYYYTFPLFVSFISLMLYIYLRNKRGRS